MKKTDDRGINCKSTRIFMQSHVPSSIFKDKCCLFLTCQWTAVCVATYTAVHWHVIFYSMVQWSSMYNGVMGYFLLRVHSWTICSSSEDFLCTECSIINSHYTNWTASWLRRVNMTVFYKNHTRTTETLTLHVQRITSTMDVSVSDILQKKLCTPNVSDTENRHPLLT